MIKSELIQKIAAANQHLYHRDIERIVNVVFNEIVEALARGDRVELRGFGAFTVKHRAPRIGRFVLLSSGASVIGDIGVGDFAKIGAGAVVTRDVPAGCTAVGVPARLTNCPQDAIPA